MGLDDEIASSWRGSIFLDIPFYRTGFSECMVRRRVASGKMSLAVGLRQCIGPLVESKTPGHDGHPLAFAPINWTVSKDHFRNQVPKAWDRPIAISLRKQTGKELFF
jgi:hypothetical protein